MAEEFQVVRVVDNRGQPCAVGLKALAEAIQEVEVGEVVEILSTDPAAGVDIGAWAHVRGHEVVKVEVEPGDGPWDTLYRHYVRRGR